MRDYQTDIRLIAATGEDLPAISSLAGVIWRESYPGIISDDQIDYMLARMYDVDAMRREIAEEGVHYDILLDRVAPIGFVAYGPGPAEGEMKIHKLYLLKAYRGRGLGSLMLHHAVEYAESGGCAAVVLNVNKNNRNAISTYLRHGFTIRNSVVIDIGGGFVMDDFVMARALPVPGHE